MQDLWGRRVSWLVGGWVARGSVHLLDSADERWTYEVIGEVAGRVTVGALPDGVGWHGDFAHGGVVVAVVAVVVE
jgi:hypothetical protein